MALDWIVAAGFEITAGNSEKVLKSLSTSTRALIKTLDTLEKSAQTASSSFATVANQAAAAAARISSLEQALRATAAAGGSAAAGADRAAAGFQRAAAAANEAAAAASRFNAEAYAGGMRGGAGAPAAVSAPRAITAERSAMLALPAVAGGGGGRGITPYAAAAMADDIPLARRIPGTGGPIGPGGGGGRGGGGGFWGGVGGLAGAAMDRTPWGRIGHMGLHAAMLGGEVGVGTAGDAIYEAGKLQQILASVKNVTGANDAQMAKARQAIFDAGDMSGESASETATMFREIARQSQGSMSFENMLGLLPQIAKMQVVMHATRGQSAEQTVDNTMALVHMFRKYDPKMQPAMMDTVLKMSELMPDNPSKAVTQMGYMLPTMKNLHVSDDDAASLMVALSRFGMGRGKGGTAIQNLLMGGLGPLQMTQHAQSGKAMLLRELGVTDAKGNSRFFTDKKGDVQGFLEQLAADEKKFGSVQFAKMAEGAFNKTGARAADMFSAPELIEQLRNIVKAMEQQKSLGLDAQAKSISGTAAFQTHRAWSNFQSLMTEMGTLTLPGVTKAMQDMGDQFHLAQVWLHQHGDLEKHIQQTVLADVKGVEQWIESHKSDWQQMGKDAKWAFDNMDKAGKALAFLGDIALKLYNVEKFAQDHSPGKVPGSLMSAAYNAGHGVADWILHPFRGRGPGANQPGQVHVNIYGGDPAAVKQAVSDGMTAAGIGPTNAALSRLRNSGSVVTSSRIPAPLTFGAPSGRS